MVHLNAVNFSCQNEEHSVLLVIKSITQILSNKTKRIEHKLSFQRLFRYELPLIKGQVLQTLLRCNAREDG